MMCRPVPFEQAVYGSFPFWNRGYAVLAQSPGCRPEWLTELRRECQRYGERPAGALGAGGIFARPLARGPWMIVRPSDQGCDDQGRPGALAFHALFVRTADYRRAGASPFGFASALTDHWTADTHALAPGACTISAEQNCEEDQRAASIVAALVARQRVMLEAGEPIDALGRRVWRALPASVRRRATVATWTFCRSPQFDLSAGPRIVDRRG